MIKKCHIICLTSSTFLLETSKSWDDTTDAKHLGLSENGPILGDFPASVQINPVGGVLKLGQPPVIIHVNRTFPSKRGFLKQGYTPSSSNLHGIFHCKPCKPSSILGYPHLWKPPYSNQLGDFPGTLGKKPLRRLMKRHVRSALVRYGWVEAQGKEDQGHPGPLGGAIFGENLGKIPENSRSLEKRDLRKRWIRWMPGCGCLFSSFLGPQLIGMFGLKYQTMGIDSWFLTTTITIGFKVWYGGFLK